ncbi:MAG: dihydrolipoyl dehydrogenase [Chloroflexi bacterium]|nr:MAG: dihydrolipoyl dehydrogenase [Chloroflexota bacterium]
MAEQSAFDVVIVGGGPGGYPAAIRAAQYGLRVALVEKERAGGVCLNWGCIPTKAMLRTADVLETMQHSADFGVLADNVRLDYPAVLKRKDTIVKGLTDGVGQLLRANGVTVYSGHARFTSANAIDVVGVGKSPLGAGGPLYNAPSDHVGQPTARVAGKNVIIATGSTPAQLPIPGVELPGVINSDGAFLLKEVPRRIIIVGGGAVGTEWATLFSAFGSEVTLVELLPNLLPFEDEDMGRTLARSFQKRGIKILTSSTVAKIEEGSEKRAKTLRVTITDKDGKNEQTSEVENVLIGVSRRPNTIDMNLEVTGVQTDKRGYITVDDRMRTNVKNVFAIGDVVGKVLLAHVATHQGLVTAGVIAGHDEKMDYKAVPAATFTHPEVASVGLTEQKAREAGHDVVVGKFPFAALGRAQTYGNTDGLIKIVADKKYGEVLGVHIIGPSASDLIPEGVLALQLEATLEDIANTIHAHPTLGEGSMEAAMVALGLPVHVGPSRRAAAPTPQPALAR